MSVLLHISDTHFGTERTEVVDALIDCAARLRPDLVVLSGDITQRARRNQFAAATDFVARLGPAPVLPIPGNHDIPLYNLYARWRHPYANYRRAFGENLAPVWQGRGMHVVAVNTTRPGRHTDGEVSPQQCREVSGLVRQAGPGDLRIVVTHQPMHVLRPEDENNLLHGSEPAARDWAAEGVDLLLGGHIHLPYVGRLSDRFAGLPREVWVVQAGTAVSRRVRDGVPNSVNVIRHDRDAAICRVERLDYGGPAVGFERVSHQNLVLHQGGRNVRSEPSVAKSRQNAHWNRLATNPDE